MEHVICVSKKDLELKPCAFGMVQFGWQQLGFK
jgi:hypothetical protein